MSEFFTMSWSSHFLIVFLLGACVLAQTLVLLFIFFRHGLKPNRIPIYLFEIAVLIEILIFALLFGQFADGYKNGLLVATGYEKVRASVFLVILILAIIIIFLGKKTSPLIVIPASFISLPIAENIFGLAYPVFFIAALIFFLGRSIKVFRSKITAIKTNISALSVIHAINCLHTGVLFSESDGRILLSNYQMQNLMTAFTGKIFRNSLHFFDAINSGQYESRYEKEELEGQRIYILKDGTAWMFTKTNLSFLRKNYINISAADVTLPWILTTKLQTQNQELRDKSDELKRTISNLQTLSKKSEIDQAKMRAHDILGQRLSVLLRIIQNESNVDYDLLISLSKGLLAELKAEQREIDPDDELKNIQEIFAAIGVDIEIEGDLPENHNKAALFLDIIRESSTNAVRHGLARQIGIKIEQINNEYKLTIKNKGHTTTAPMTHGTGIERMRNKLAEQKGTLKIVPYPYFTIFVVLPGGDEDG